MRTASSDVGRLDDMENGICMFVSVFTRERFRIFLLIAVLLLCLFLVGCKIINKLTAPTEPTTEAVTAAPVVLPDTAPDTDALFASAAGSVFRLSFRSGDVSMDTFAPLTDGTKLSTSLFSVPNRLFSLHVENGYRLFVCSWNYSGERSRLPAAGDTIWYAQKNARWAFVLERTDGGEITEAEADMVTVTLLDPDAVQPASHGLWTLLPVWGASDSYGGGFALQPGEQVSAPLPLSDGGLGVLFGGDETSAAKSFRVAAFRLSDDGIVPAEDAVLQQMNNAGEIPAQSFCLPETKDCYAVLILKADNDPGLLTLTGGHVNAEAQARLSGLFNMNIRLDEGENGPILQMIQYYADQTIANQEYLGAILRVSDVERITCDPRFELTATLWAPDAAGTLIRTKTFWNGVQPGGKGPRGFNAIVPDGNDTGFLLLCVHRRAEPLQTAAGEFAVKSRGMGAMRGYEEVSAGVAVDFVPGREQRLVQFDNPIITQNLHDITSLTAPHVYGGVYSTPQNPEKKSAYPEMSDLSPVWYNGRFMANAYLHHVSPRSYLTAAANPNSRYYLFSQPQGYGSTCINFSTSVLGITEEYAMSQLWKDEMLKFDRAAFSVETDLDALLPGDLLLEIDHVSLVGHLMIVKEKGYTADGSLFYVTILEGYPPFSRQRTFYVTGAPKMDSTLLYACSPAKLKNYECRLRIRPEYVRSLRDSFDMTPDLTTGTVMCDRGSDAIYCIKAKRAELSVTDESAQKVRFFRDGNFAGEISLAKASRRNGLRVVSFAHLLTDPGLYTVKTDQSEDVQERFYVPEQKRGFRLDRNSAGENGGNETITITVADPMQIDSVKIFYRREKSDDPDDKRPEYDSVVHPPESLVPSADPKYGPDWGCITVPAERDGMRYSNARVYYRTPFGSFWTGYNRNVFIQTAEVSADD